MVRDDMKRIGARVRTRRLAAGLSVPRLARATGATPRYVEMIEAGTRIPSVPMLYRLAAALHTTAADLLTDEDGTGVDASENALAHTG
jgi:XRE family transcriptional regulator, fatty acid utilization regulator